MLKPPQLLMRTHNLCFEQPKFQIENVKTIESWFYCYSFIVILLFLFVAVTSLFLLVPVYCYTPCALHTCMFDTAAKKTTKHVFCIVFFFFLIQFNVPFKIISLIETSQWVGGEKREYPGKTT